MTINVTLSPLTPPAPGQAILNVRGWEESSSALEFAIQRGRDEFYLQQSEQWGNNPYWFKIDRFHEIDGNLQLLVGKDVVDPLLSASSDGALQFKMRLQDGSAEEEQTMRLKDGLLTSLAGADQGGYTSSESGGHLQQPVVPAPAPIPETEIPKATLPDIPAAPLIPAVIPPPVPPKNNTLLWLIPLILLLLIAMAAGGWFFLNKGKSESKLIGSDSSPVAPAAIDSAPSNLSQTDSTDVTSTQTVPAETTSPETASPEVAPAESISTETAPAESASTEAAPEEPASTAAAPEAGAPCSAENMVKLTELMFVQGCVKSVPSSAEMLKTINAAKDSKKCGIAQRLYAHRGQAGDVKIATAYAHEYDPKFHQPSECFKAPDAATAAYWYETILGLEPDNVEAKQRFEELKP